MTPNSTQVDALVSHAIDEFRVTILKNSEVNEGGNFLNFELTEIQREYEKLLSKGSLTRSNLRRLGVRAIELIVEDFTAREGSILPSPAWRLLGAVKEIDWSNNDSVVLRTSSATRKSSAFDASIREWLLDTAIAIVVLGIVFEGLSRREAVKALTPALRDGGLTPAAGRATTWEPGLEARLKRYLKVGLGVSQGFRYALFDQLDGGVDRTSLSWSEDRFRQHWKFSDAVQSLQTNCRNLALPKR